MRISVSTQTGYAIRMGGETRMHASALRCHARATQHRVRRRAFSYGNSSIGSSQVEHCASDPTGRVEQIMVKCGLNPVPAGRRQRPLMLARNSRGSQTSEFTALLLALSPIQRGDADYREARRRGSWIRRPDCSPRNQPSHPTHITDPGYSDSRAPSRAVEFAWALVGDSYRCDDWASGIATRFIVLEFSL